MVVREALPRGTKTDGAPAVVQRVSGQTFQCPATPAFVIITCSFGTCRAAASSGPFWKSNDPYRRLQLTSDATAKDIRDRFKELARQWHPDKCRAPEAAEAFHAIREAYDVLSKT
eukprot:scaffold1804_cov263-Pinguiococcus_pyrenoidosus.AAC.24